MRAAHLLPPVAAAAVAAFAPAVPAASSPAKAPELSVAITTPARGATLRGPVRLGVSHRGPRPQRVDFYLNGRLRHVDRQPPFLYKGGRVYPSELRHGRNSLRVVARRGSRRAQDAITVFLAPSAADLALPRVPWEGGTAYYGRFPKAHATGWSSPGFFPISVFLGKPAHARIFRSVGINTYQGAERDGSSIGSMTSAGMFVLPQQDEWTAAQVGDDPRAVGWLVGDECEMGFSGCNGPDEYANLAIWRNRAAALRARNDGRFLHGNFGNGVLGTFWAGRTFAQYVQAVDTSSVDKYAYTSPHVWSLLPRSPHWPRGADVARSGAYGWLARRMHTYQDPSNRRPVWVFVETARPFLTEGGARSIAPHEIEGAVWAAIINEARGIAYFQHNNNGVCGTYSIVDCGADLRTKLTAVHAKIRSLAPVINTQSYRHNFSNGTETMLKTHDGNAYVFAGIGLKQSSGTKTFTLPAGIQGTTVTVEGEGRTIPVGNRRFSDDFAAEYTHHVYRIPLAATR